ncbi:outer membrane beta-barrel protein [Alteraurantiacibacter aquimixticola]|uniref:outer membrane beta-barrel protein n=1 Tax=Alteraurantiacibacter aquimixticola TaxID=2489173 RepID=UPI00145BF3D4|nr:outer membrane beta-barrel protein [Alteraurantiacibacter aquimixticola]
MSFAVLPSGALAQEIPDGVGVADRVRPEFQPVGGRVGSFFIYPEIEATVELDDNVFASEDDRKSDAIGTLEPSVRLQSSWSRHMVRATARYRLTRFADNSSENTDEYGVGFSGRLDTGSSADIRVRLEADRLAEERYDIASPSASESPIQYGRLLASLQARQRLGRFNAIVGASVRTLDFEDNRTRDGEPIDGDIRNVDVVSGDLTVSYGGGAAFRTFVRGAVEKRSYPFGPEDADFDPTVNFNRDSEGFRLEGGISVEIRDRLYGNVRAGYLVQNYDDPQLRDIDGFSFGADLLWNPTLLTSARLAVSRAVDLNTSVQNAGNLRTSYSLVVSHELRRNIVLTGAGTFATISPVGPGENSREYEASAGVTYLLNRRYSLAAGLIHRSRSSDDPNLRFDANRAVLTLRARF